MGRFLLTMLVLIGMLFYAPVTSGARSWVSFGGVGLQPSELAKVIAILALAHYFAERDPRPFGMRGLMVPGVLSAVPFVLIALQPDLGTASTFLPMLAGIAWVAGVRLATAARLAGAALCVMPLGYFILEDYQRARLLTFWNPEVDPLGDGYQIIQSKIAVGSGGLLGTGYLEGTQTQLRFLPTQHTDFAFSVLAEEWGFLGSVVVLAVYLSLLLWGVVVARHSKDSFGAMLAVGVTGVLFWPAALNIAMVLGLAPVIGVPFPLFSYGGSALVTSLIALGLLMNVSMRRYVF